MVSIVQINPEFHTEKKPVLDFTKEGDLLYKSKRRLVNVLDHHYLKNEVGETFDAVQFQNRLDNYQKITQEIDDLSNRITALQTNPKWEKTKCALCGLSWSVMAVAIAALTAGFIYFIFFAGGNPEAMVYSPIVLVPLLALTGFCFGKALDYFKTSLENLETAQDKLANKKKIAAELETHLITSKKTLRNIRESLIAKNAAYEQWASDSPFSHAAMQAKSRNLVQISHIDWLNIL
jgi:hypothetical protein